MTVPLGVDAAGMRFRLLQAVPALEAAVRDQPHARNRDVKSNGDPRRYESRRDTEGVETETDPFLLPGADHGPNPGLRAFGQDQLAFEPHVTESRHHGYHPISGHGLRGDSCK